LFIVGVPIGHPDDVTVRALDTFRNVGLIATKSPRATQALLIHHGIDAVLTTYDRDNAVEKAPLLLDRLKQGTAVALVSDCGMPVVYDPGRLLIAAAAEADIPIEVIPGPSAVVTAAAVAGLDCNAFVFEGRWVGGAGRIMQRLHSLQSESRTMIFFPPAQTILRILTLISDILGNRRIIMAINLTQKAQHIVRGRARELRTGCPFLNETAQVTLIVEGKKPTRKGLPKNG
jgi:16S rRNA (cytidine1402-2'-O)-methyltransferase